MICAESATPVHKDELLASLPPEWDDPTLFAAIQRDVCQIGRKVIVLDDDPTGTQTVHNVPVLMRWSVQELRDALKGEDTVVYILTNSRSVSTEQAIAMNREIAANLARAAREMGSDFVVVSRSDSTLRGHYPAEIDALRDTLEREAGWTFDGHVVIPFFFEGGRFTINDVHWVQEGDMLIPAAQTEYASDATFGYHHSNLRQWIEEKTQSRYRADKVFSISLDVLRGKGPARVVEILSAVKGGWPVIVNAASCRDLQVFVAGLLRAEGKGKRFLFRTGASFVKVRGGIANRGLLRAAELYGSSAREGGGLIVVGSYVQKSSEQLRAVLALDNLVSVELNVARVLNPSLLENEIARAVSTLERALAAGHTGLVFTSRTLVTGATKEESLRIGQSVSNTLVEVVRRVQRVPRFIVAKGGITSSDIATRGLNVQRARVLGQIAAGVSVWRLGAESRFPGMPYVVFPGNVGSRDTLAQVVEELRK